MGGGPFGQFLDRDPLACHDPTEYRWTKCDASVSDQCTNADFVVSKVWLRQVESFRQQVGEKMGGIPLVLGLRPFLFLARAVEREGEGEGEGEGTVMVEEARC